MTSNGPVPTGDSQFVACLRSSAFGDSMPTHGCEKDSSSALSGRLSESVTVWSSVAVAFVMDCSARYPVLDAVAGSCTCSMFATTAAASNGVPSVKVTSSRSVKVRVLPSSLVVHFVASSGVGSPSSSPTSSSMYCVARSACG
ncbi:hypothetical protein QP157_18350 [Sphingomonas sp. LR61]